MYKKDKLKKEKVTPGGDHFKILYIIKIRILY